MDIGFIQLIFVAGLDCVFMASLAWVRNNG